MICSTSRCKLLEIAAGLGLILSTLLVGCSEVANNTHGPSTSPTQANISCTQPASNKFSLVGLAYGAAHTGQNPLNGIFPSNEEVTADMSTLASLTHYIRTYSSTGNASEIIQAAAAAHICVASGIALGSDPVANAKEMAAGEQLAANSAVHAIIVGNEVLQNGDLSEAQIRSDIEQVRARLARPVPITVADTYTAWLQHPALANIVDFITVHIYPFWQGVSVDSAIQFLDQASTRVQKAFPDKRIVIGETGWPSDGPPYKDAVPGAANQAQYLQAFLNWANARHVQYFYFEAFDEDWKVNEQGVGTHWGLYQQNGQVKPALRGILPAPAYSTLIERSSRDIYVNGPTSGFVVGMDTSEHLRQWLTNNDGTTILHYPANQLWGVLFITVGPTAPPGYRSSIDMSAYHALVVDLRAAANGTCVRIGLKDVQQPDDGSETSVPLCPKTQWTTFTIPLNKFTGTDLTHLYVVFEILFYGQSNITLAMRNVRYSPT